MKTRRTALRLSLALAALSLGAACTGAPETKKDPELAEVPTQRLDLDPTLIRGGSEDGTASAVNAEDVFKSAFAAFSGRRYEEAIKHYATIVEYFPDSRFMLPSLFNMGLANEKLERWEPAAKAYRTILEKFPKNADAKDAYYRLAHVSEKLGDHETIVDLMTQAMLRTDINHFDRMEAHVRRAAAMLELGQAKEAEDGFQAMLRMNRQADASQQLPSDAQFIVQAQFGLGRALHLQVMAIPLVLPTDKMGEDLETKANLFLSSQSAYIRALREHHPRWSLAAGYMIGRLYEDFYLDILSAEIPDDLTDEQVTMYFDELRSQLRPLMVRAIQVYEKNLSLSRRIDARHSDNEWAQASDTHLKRLKAYLDDPFTQRRAERLVLQKRPLEELWDPRLMATDVVLEAVENATKASTKASKNKS
jgi:tetratricopeptide (TPR) repeat protein